MDTHHLLHVTPSGLENQGVHVCHICGWAFPNPHPSAKHRRAHKRICGTIEGYKLIGSEDHTHVDISDDEQDHPSDDDCKIPSPKFEKKSIIGSERSNRSEDEVFSDAAAEFLDNNFSLGTEERLGDVKQLDKNVQTTTQRDLGPIQSLKVDVIADITEPQIIPPKDHNIGNDEVLDNATASIMPSQATKTQEVAVASPGFNDSLRDLSFETPAVVPTDILRANIGDNGKQCLTTSFGQETEVMANKDQVKEFLIDVEEPQRTTSCKISDTESELQVDGKASVSIPGNGFESVHFESVESKMSVHSHASPFEPVELTGASVNTTHDLVQDMNSVNNVDLLEIVDPNNVIKKMIHELSVANDLPTDDNADIMLKDFKDHKTLKSDNSTNLSSVECTRPSKEGMGFDESLVTLHSDKTDEASTKPEGKKSVHYLSHLSQPAEHIELSVNTVQAKADSFEDMDSDTHVDLFEICDTDKGTKEPIHVHSVESVSATAYADIMLEDFKDHIFNFTPNLGSADAIRPLTGGNEGMEIEVNSFGTHSDKPNEIHRSSADTINTGKNNLRQNCVEDMLTVEGPAKGVINASKFSVRTSEIMEFGGVEARQSTRNEVNPEEFVTDGNEVRNEGDTKTEFSSNASSNFLYEGSHRTTKLTGGNDMGELEKVQFSDEAWSDKRAGVAAEEKNCATTTFTKLEPGHGFLYSNTSDISASIPSNVMPICSSLQNFPGDDCHLSVESKVDTVNEVLEDKLGGPFMKEQESFPIHSKFSNNGSSPDDKVGHSSDNVKGQTAVVSELMQESDDKLSKQFKGASAAYVLLDSNSQSVWVDGDRCSVSVLSALSNGPAISGIEVTTKIDPEGLRKSENTSQRQESEKADVFEPPSFMSLVEPRGWADQKSTAFGIVTEQGTQQPCSQALQAGWLPSLSNVVNESPGRKKNEEIIAKVTNWSAGKQQSTPFKNLLGEMETNPKPLSPKQMETNIQKDGTADKFRVTSATTVKEVLGSEASADQVVNRKAADEWNSPARYPVKIKKEKKKVKGKPSWVPFVCCSSPN